MEYLIARFEVLSILPQYLIVGAIAAILVPIVSGLFVGCVLIASRLGLIDWDRSGSKKQATARVDQIPDSTEKTASLLNAGRAETDDGKGRL